ncbi:HNH endonuclease [Halovenus marina]|uniref:HNH endonuclease n=1 Tax=Halovenus marina TaxID=3396621 RepID=UPI003F578A55
MKPRFAPSPASNPHRDGFHQLAATITGTECIILSKESSIYTFIMAPDDVTDGSESIGSFDMSDSSPNKRHNSGTEFSIKRITVKSAPNNSRAAYEYSDLKQDSSRGTVVVHAIFWPIYLLLIFPIQYIVRAFIFGFWKNWSVGTRLILFMRGGYENSLKLRFLWNEDRRALYLRASRLYTPAQLFPFLLGTSPISEDSSSEAPPKSKNWDVIRKQVYERDGYTCVNCGASGGSNGNAEIHADHVLPRSRDGSDELQNLRTLCRECHEARHARIFN